MDGKYEIYNENIDLDPTLLTIGKAFRDKQFPGLTHPGLNHNYRYSKGALNTIAAKLGKNASLIDDAVLTRLARHDYFRSCYEYLENLTGLKNEALIPTQAAFFGLLIGQIDCSKTYDLEKNWLMQIHQRLEIHIKIWETSSPDNFQGILNLFQAIQTFNEDLYNLALKFMDNVRTSTTHPTPLNQMDFYYWLEEIVQKQTQITSIGEAGSQDKENLYHQYLSFINQCCNEIDSVDLISKTQMEPDIDFVKTLVHSLCDTNSLHDIKIRILEPHGINALNITEIASKGVHLFGNPNKKPVFIIEFKNEETIMLPGLKLNEKQYTHFAETFSEYMASDTDVVKQFVQPS